ncbi:MAG: YacL family protein [Pseudomonadales bacterium]|nr:YacL family protein [Pseudomonadales bacterium]NRA17008.1 YacL family protein [Oceanospirillaceae bacterium]
MEYSFSRNDIDQPVARLNMEAEAFSHWLNIEMCSDNTADLQKIALAVAQLLAGQLWQFEFEGREFHLQLSRQQASISANTVLQQRLEAEQQDDFGCQSQDDDLDDEYSDEYQELSETESGLVSSCGLEDFQLLLMAWISYVEVKQQ